MNEKSSVYIKTTIPSYLTSRPSKNIVIAGEQEVTRQWWEERQSHYHLYTSNFVIEEAKCGDENAAKRRLSVLEHLELLLIDEETIRLTKSLLNSGVIPEKAAADASHIAVASRHGMEFLLTWNCTHIANAELIRKISFVISEEGYYVPVICTPVELFGG